MEESSEDLFDLQAFKASSNPDTLYFSDAMKEPDAQKFKEAMVKEVKDHTTKNHWKIILKKDVPRGYKILPAVWAMKRKIAALPPEKPTNGRASSTLVDIDKLCMIRRLRPL